MGYMKKKVYLAVALGTALLVTGCGKADSSELATINGKEFTNTDYIEMMNSTLDAETKQSAFIDKVIGELANEEKTDKVYNDYLDQLESSDKEMYDSLSEDEKDALKEASKQQAGMVEALKKSELVTGKQIDKEYKERNKKAVVDAVIIPQDSDVKASDVEDILKEKDTEGAGKALEKLDDTLNYEKGTEYTEYTAPREVMSTFDKEEGDVFTEELDGISMVLKVNSIEKLAKEELENEIVLTLGGESVQDNITFIEAMEDKNIIKIKKDLREYLQLDEEKATAGEEKETK